MALVTLHVPLLHFLLAFAHSSWCPQAWGRSDMRSSLLLMQHLGNLDRQLLIAIETRFSCSDILAVAAF